MSQSKFVGTFRSFKGPTDLAAVDSDGDFFDVAQQAFLDHVDRPQKRSLGTALLSANEERQILMFVARGADLFVLFKGKG